MITTGQIVHNNCWIKKGGFLYPIHINSGPKFRETLDILENSKLDLSARQWHFTTLNNCFSIKKIFDDQNLLKDEISIRDRKWYAGPRRWNSTNKYDFWFVFKNESDRSYALKLLSMKKISEIDASEVYANTGVMYHYTTTIKRKSRRNQPSNGWLEAAFSPAQLKFIKDNSVVFRPHPKHNPILEMFVDETQLDDQDLLMLHLLF